MRYRAGYKYRLEEDTQFTICVYPAQDIFADYIQLTSHGQLTLFRGYAWDGSSGPAIDTRSSMAASAVHDALYQLIRLGKLSWIHRRDCDLEYYRLCREHGMWAPRAWLHYHCVRYFAGFAVEEDAEKPVVEV